MIKLINVKKTFKSKSSKIHAINNTSLELGSNGLVALLGPSGCGKTTILNTIGGLDKINKGKIYVEDKLISSKFSHKIDNIRNEHIGYIFQDYKLINNLTVFENVEIVLKMIGVKNKEERTKRVEFILEKVGMLRYKRRPCSMLSGGERQRVAIARALVKNPDIILADEPTGNLDSKNSLEIMKLISTIAKEKLVILVTHESKLAKFYATRIIEIKDGIVEKDYENKSIDDLDYEIENRFYLKDFKNIETIKDKNHNITVYSDENEKVDFSVVFKNGNIYIKSDQKVEVIDDNSNIELVDDHYKKINKEDVNKLNFNLSDVIETKKIKYSSIFNFVTFFTSGFKKVFKYTLLKKILLGGFFASASFILVALSIFLKSIVINEEDYIKTNRNYVVTSALNLDYEDIETLKGLDNVNYLIPTESNVEVYLEVNSLNQFYEPLNIMPSVSSLREITEDNLIVGSMPQNKYEVLVDKILVDNYIQKEQYKMQGIHNIEDFLNLEISTKFKEKYKIVGIVDNKNFGIYLEEEEMYNFINNTSLYNEMLLVNYENYEGEFILKSGDLPINDFEIMINYEERYTNKIGSKIKINDLEYTVSGYYEGSSYNNSYINENTEMYNYIKSSEKIALHTDNKEELITDLRDYQIVGEDIFKENKDLYLEEIKSVNQIVFIIASIILAVSLFEIFLMIRSSFLSRVKEVGIYRAIGVKKSDIYKMFIGEIFAITILVCMPAQILTYYILSNVSSLKLVLIVNPLVLLASFILVLVFNIFIGLLPVYTTIRKTPAYILSRNDVE